jgi:protein BCP1
MVKPTKEKKKLVEEEEEEKVPSPAPADRPEDSSDEESSSSDEEDEELVLEGVIVRNPDVSDSDDTTSSEESEEEDDDSDEDGDEDTKPPPSKKQRPIDPKGKAVVTKQQAQKQPKKNKKKKTKSKGGPEMVHVDFTFCDMDTTYFYGLKTLLTSTSPVYAAQSSGLADLMIENISVGTVVSTEGDTEGTVFGFASVLNVTTNQKQPCIQGLKQICLEQCPEAHKPELETVLSGKTKRPAGFYFHGRMVNMPLEIVEILHQQLVLDMDWAVEHAEGGEDERKSLDFGAFVRLAPAYRSSGTTYYKLFDDEIFAQHAEFSYEVTLPKTFGMDETPYCMAVVLTKTGHRAAMKELSQMVNGGGSAAASAAK